MELRYIVLCSSHVRYIVLYSCHVAPANKNKNIHFHDIHFRVLCIPWFHK